MPRVADAPDVFHTHILTSTSAAVSNPSYPVTLGAGRLFGHRVTFGARMPPPELCLDRLV
jgi:hypothetical protein